MKLQLMRWFLGPTIKMVLSMAYECAAINQAQYAALYRCLLVIHPGKWLEELNRVNNWALSVEELADPEGMWNDIKEMDERKRRMQ